MKEQRRQRKERGRERKKQSSHETCVRKECCRQKITIGSYQNSHCFRQDSSIGAKTNRRKLKG